MTIITRQIKFRGRRLSDNKWVYGDLLEGSDGQRVIVCAYVDGLETRSSLINIYNIIVIGRVYEVDPKTIGMLTGLKDMHGNEIYEADIIDTPQRGIEVVEIDQEYDMIGYHLCWEKGKVIGNIHENPELLWLRHEII